MDHVFEKSGGCGGLTFFRNTKKYFEKGKKI